ncbi:MAG TPA: hypothetical protein VHI71_05720 [Actinomycetota bacterium]|nr:hypothetical protein [Actinomycetota bacterium]
MIAGGLTAGLAAGVVGGLASFVPRPMAAILVLACAALACVVDAAGSASRLPQNGRQVPKEIDRRGPVVAALQFGFELGTGARTYVTSAAPYAALAAVVFLGDVPAAMSAGFGFGMGRAAMTTLRFVSRDVDAWDRLLARRIRAIALASTVCAALAVSGLVVLETRSF